MTSEKWMIRVAGYGTFTFEGTEDEAEEMRAHKARWEGGVAMKWRADLTRKSDQIAAEIAEIYDRGHGVPSSLVKRWREELSNDRAGSTRV